MKIVEFLSGKKNRLKAGYNSNLFVCNLATGDCYSA